MKDITVETEMVWAIQPSIVLDDPIDDVVLAEDYYSDEDDMSEPEMEYPVIQPPIGIPFEDDTQAEDEDNMSDEDDTQSEAEEE